MDFKPKMNPLLHGPLSKSNESVSSGLEWISIRLYEHCSLLESPAGTELMYQSLTACKRLMSLLVKHKAECFCCRAVRSAHSLPNNLSVTSFTCFNPVGVIGQTRCCAQDLKLAPDITNPSGSLRSSITWAVGLFTIQITSLEAVAIFSIQSMVPLV